MTGATSYTAKLAAGLILATLSLPTGAQDAFVLQRRIGEEEGPQRPQSLRAVAVSADRVYVALAGEPATPTINNVVQLRELATGKLVHTLRGHETVVRAIEFDSDGEWLATVTSDSTGTGSVRVFDLETGRLLRTIDAGGSQIRILPDGRLVVAGFGRAFVYEAATGRELARRDATALVKHLSQDGRRLVGVSHHGSRTLDVRELETGTTIASLDGCTREPVAAVFSPDGQTLAAGDPRSNTVLLWEVRTGQIVHTLQAGVPVTALAFAGGGRYLLAGDVEGKLRAWEVATGSDAGRTDAHEGAVTAIAVGRDRTLISGATDRTVGVWSLAGLNGSTLPEEPLNHEDIDELWNSLAAPDAKAAYRSLGRIAKNAGKAMPAMATRVERQLLPISKADRERLLTELNDPDVRTRERATAQLGQAGDAMRPHLEQRLATAASPEVRARLRQLLRVAGRAPRFSPGDELRLRRLISAAGLVPGDASKRLLRLIAEDTGSPAIAEEARQMLERLGD